MPENNSRSEFFNVNLTEIVFPELSEYCTLTSPLSSCVVVSCNVLRSFDCNCSLAEIPLLIISGSSVVSVKTASSSAIPSCGNRPWSSLTLSNFSPMLSIVL